MEEKNEISIDLKEVVLSLRKHMKFIIAGTVFCVLLGIVYLLLVTPMYESRALLRITIPQDVDRSLLKSTPIPDAWKSRFLMTTYAEILKSNAVVNPALEKLKKAEGAKAQGEKIQYKVNVDSVRDTDIMRLSVQSNDPEKAKQANDLIVENFLYRLTEISQAKDKQQRSFIEKRRGIALENLNAAEKNLSDFREKNKFVNTSSAMDLIKEQSGRIDRSTVESKLDLAAAQANLKEANSRLAELENSVPSNNNIVQYEQKISEFTAKRLEYLGKYGEWHPSVVELDDEILILKKRLEEEVARVSALNIALKKEALVAKFKNELAIESAQNQLQKLAELDEENNKQIKRFADLYPQYNTLTRNTDSARDIYNMLNRLLEQARVAEASGVNEVQVLTPAAISKVPINTKKTTAIGFAFFVGLFASCGLVICQDIIKQIKKNIS